MPGRNKFTKLFFIHIHWLKGKEMKAIIISACWLFNNLIERLKSS